jgi:hypothetical protein
MKKLFDTLITATYTGALIAASVVLPASSAKAANIDVGGLNLDAYCRTFYGSNSRLISYNAGGWRCPSRYGLASVNTNAVCQWQYRNSGLWAQALNWSNPYSWRCFKNQPQNQSVIKTLVR